MIINIWIEGKPSFQRIFIDNLLFKAGIAARINNSNMIMKKKDVKNQNSSEVFSMLDLSLIDKSNYNPRKTFDDTELTELANSIREKGVIQPIVVRIKGQRYELVCGERRYRASLLAEQTSIPACIRVLTDEEAEEFAITENLQRKDVSPLEEARAFARLVETGKYDISSLSAKFGKSDPFIRGRIKLVQLIAPFQNLLEKDEINLGVANTLANYSKDLQETIFNDHFTESCGLYSSWRNKKPTQLQKDIESQYSCCLEDYFFDKTECQSCPLNTINFSLFTDDIKARCTKSLCLYSKNEEFVHHKAITMQKEFPELALCKDTCWATNDNVVNQLLEEGYDIQTVNLTGDYQEEEPIAPQRDHFETDEEFAEAFDSYEERLVRYEEEMAERDSLIKNGKLKAYIQIEKFDVRIAYAEPTIEHTNTVIVENKSQMLQNPEVVKLSNKITRNNELCGEKIEANLKNYLKSVKVQNKPVSKLEETLMYFFMAKKVSHEHISLLGFDKSFYQLNYVDFLTLTDEQKAIIIRDYIIEHLGRLYIPTSNKEDNALVAFMNEHVEDIVSGIFKEQNAIYKKRNDRLMERIVLLQSENQSTEESAEN